MDDRITIIEGPPPNFESMNDGWAIGWNESPLLYDLALTQLRTHNGHALVERCHLMWRRGQPIFLHYRNTMGLEESAPIMAARAVESADGPVLLLWIRQEMKIEEEQEEDGNEPGESI